ncbi:cupin domain-containing protein [Micromonospora sp. NPDC093277]|uniref:cupin domain-containing protein n=1 Tax=Micromonospora sp. NPDC093277 TaxID=3364291 RepID=UPI003829FF40
MHVPATEVMTMSVTDEYLCYQMGGQHGDALLTTFIATTVSDTALVVMCTVVPPGQGARARVHEDFDESIYVLDGELEIAADGRSFPVGPGDYVLLSGGVSHAWRNPGDRAARIIRTCTSADQEVHPFRVAGTGR